MRHPEIRFLSTGAHPAKGTCKSDNKVRIGGLPRYRSATRLRDGINFTVACFFLQVLLEEHDWGGKGRRNMFDLKHHIVEANGIRIHVAEQGEGPVVLFCHGFPESWYSWRHQLPALAEAGFRAVAPDMRGYGETESPTAIDQYTLLHLVGDMVGLLDALCVEKAVIVGHDWGAPVAWYAALLRPDRFRGVVGLSVPFLPLGQVYTSPQLPE